VDKRIASARLGDVVRVPGEVFGDTWSTCEGPGATLFAAADDSKGFGDVCFSNLCVNTLDGSAPKLTGTTVNPMTGYGAMCETGPDLANWKACGITAVDGSLFLTVSRHHYMKPPFWRQEAWDASIVRSDDAGQTWTAVPALGHATFPGQNFATPIFIDYGPDVTNAPHGGDSYVYALSTTGHWNNGHAMTLGRVRRDRIARLDAADWEFAHGFAENGAPDLSDEPPGLPVWRPRHDTALPVFLAPGRTGMAGATWAPALGLYILPQWHFPHLDRPNPLRWQHSRWEFYSAPAPWGPWTRFFTADFAPQGFYNPSIPSRFLTDDGTGLWLLTCGDFSTHAYYALHAAELTLTAVPPEVD
jgi:hypothetical protein